MAVKYTDKVIRAAARKVAEDLLYTTDDMSKHVLFEVMEALDRGEDVYDDLVNTIFTRPFMERLATELLKYKE